MKLVPGKFLDDNLQAPENFVLPIWDFIEMNLNALKIDEQELVYLFDVSKQALENWKNESRNMTIDKIAVLCEMFGITLDQFVDRDTNDDFQLDDFIGLSRFKNVEDCKKLKFKDLYNLFDSLNEATFYFEYFALGYIPFDKSPDDPPNVDEDFYRHYVSADFVEYYCQTLDINVKYDTKEGKEIFVESVTYDELCKITDIISKDWGDKSFEHITATPNKKYKVMMMKSENHKYLKHHIKDLYDRYKNELLEIWKELKEEDDSYDKNSMMAKILITSGARLGTNEEMQELCMNIFKSDISEEEDE